MFRVDRLLDHDEIEIKPNCSLSWDAAKIVMGVISSIILLIALYFASIGAWLVLPFSGAEIIIVILGFYLSSRKLHERELIKINQDEIKVYHGFTQPNHVVSLNRFWAKVKYSQDARNWYQDKLFIHSHGKYIEVGKGLTNEEKHKLSQKLKTLLG